MKLSNLKIGDRISHYCFGELIQATVIDVTKNSVITEHEPVFWGRECFTNTIIKPPTQFQRSHDETATTPKSFYNNIPITA